MTTSPATLARTATLVVVGSSEKLAEAADVIRRREEEGALRLVLIPTDSLDPAIPADHADVVTVRGLRPEFVNNAIAGQRLSSLPTVVWWRGGPFEGVDGVASLAERVILDVEDPWPLWKLLPARLEHSAITDMRWARLTRWRAAMAHFFDMPEVLEAAPSFSRLKVTGSDRPRAALFAGWIDASLGWKGRVTPEFAEGMGAPLECATLGGPGGELILRLMPNATCLEAEARSGGRVLASRVVSAGDERLESLLSEELRIRSRDIAFERALASAVNQG